MSSGLPAEGEPQRRHSEDGAVKYGRDLFSVQLEVRPKPGSRWPARANKHATGAADLDKLANDIFIPFLAREWERAYRMSRVRAVGS